MHGSHIEPHRVLARPITTHDRALQNNVNRIATFSAPRFHHISARISEGRGLTSMTVRDCALALCVTAGLGFVAPATLAQSLMQPPPSKRLPLSRGARSHRRPGQFRGRARCAANGTDHRGRSAQGHRRRQARLGQLAIDAGTLNDIIGGQEARSARPSAAGHGIRPGRPTANANGSRA